MTTLHKPTCQPGTVVAPFEGWAVMPHPQDMRMGLSAEPLFVTTRGHGTAFFDAQNAKTILTRVTGRALYVDLIRSYEEVVHHD